MIKSSNFTASFPVPTNNTLNRKGPIDMCQTVVTSEQPAAWQVRTQEYREAAAAKIPNAWRLEKQYTQDGGPSSDLNVLNVPANRGILTEREVDITENHDAVSLLEHLVQSDMTSEEVTIAFSKRAAIAQQLTCCLTETMFDTALSRARECDRYLAEHKEPMGPLHGLPISIKDSFDVKNVRSTIGFVSFLDRDAAADDAALVKVLLSLGAVIYVKTNIPQSLMTADSHNNIFGRCLNPNKLSLGAGGSSGGEGALLAMRGSPIGVGTDIAGSIRIPAYVNGTFGFKPTCQRIPYGGQANPGREGMFGILPCAGPLARSVRDVEMFMKAVLSYDCWKLDESVVSVPWREQNPSTPGEKKLKLGYILEDPKRPLHPTVMRTMKTVIAKLEAAGHALVPLAAELPRNILAEATESAFSNFIMDPNKTSLGFITTSGEPVVPSIPTATLPELKHFKPELDDVWRLNVEKQGIQKLFRQLYASRDLDAVVLPTYQATAVPHDKYGVPYYTVLANLLDYPSMTIPFLKAEKALDAKYRRDVTYVPPCK